MGAEGRNGGYRANKRKPQDTRERALQKGWFHSPPDEPLPFETMIITRTPLRLSIAGGGTDLPSFYTKFGSSFVSAAINKYVYITYHRSDFDPSIRVRYSKMEEVLSLNDLNHEIVRETLKHLGIAERVEITSHAEVPSGTGLGSSGSFGVGVLNALHEGEMSQEQLSVESTYIQVELLNHPIGKQDQYVASFGGF